LVLWASKGGTTSGEWLTWSNVSVSDDRQRPLTTPSIHRKLKGTLVRLILNAWPTHSKQAASAKQMAFLTKRPFSEKNAHKDFCGRHHRRTSFSSALH
jgi:hypothetical protein